MTIRIQEHVPLRELTTLKVGGPARYFVSISSVEELKEAVLFAQEKQLPVLVLGGGSNVLISDGEIEALVVKIAIRGIAWGSHSPFVKGSTAEGGEGFKSSASEDLGTSFYKGGTREDGAIAVIAGAGESWDALVAEAVKRGLWGIENLSGIPGTVGAAPIQNIGAYGAEIKDALEWVEVFNTETGEARRIADAECQFGYRDSIFKHPEGKSLIITRVALRLSKNGEPNLKYKDLKESFNFQFSILNEKEKQAKIKELMPTDIRRTVVEIRSRKFPDLRTHGTAGSFFKNPIISQTKFNELKKEYPELPGFPVGADKRGYKKTRINADNSLRIKDEGLRIKVSLAWILDNICGLKGYHEDTVALFANQPIVLVNFGGATAEKIRAFAEEITVRVKEKTGITIEPEVQYL